jgi:hypothetical protein
MLSHLDTGHGAQREAVGETELAVADLPVLDSEVLPVGAEF